MSSAETLTVTNITLPETELPKVKMININNVMYRCEREDENSKHYFKLFWTFLLNSEY